MLLGQFGERGVDDGRERGGGKKFRDVFFHGKYMWNYSGREIVFK